MSTPFWKKIRKKLFEQVGGPGKNLRSNKTASLRKEGNERNKQHENNQLIIYTIFFAMKIAKETDEKPRNYY